MYQTRSQLKNLLSLKCNGVGAVVGTGAAGAIVDGVIAGGTGLAGAAAGMDADGTEAVGMAQALASWSAAAVAP
jgi:hypothetical protein